MISIKYNTLTLLTDNSIIAFPLFHNLRIAKLPIAVDCSPNSDENSTWDDFPELELKLFTMLLG